MGDYPVHGCVHVFAWAGACARTHSLSPRDLHTCDATDFPGQDAAEGSAESVPSYSVLI